MPGYIMCCLSPGKKHDGILRTSGASNAKRPCEVAMPFAVGDWLRGKSGRFHRIPLMAQTWRRLSLCIQLPQQDFPGSKRCEIQVHKIFSSGLVHPIALNNQ